MAAAERIVPWEEDLERVAIRERVPPGAWEQLFVESAYFPRETQAWSGMDVPAAVTEFPGVPSLAWLKRRVQLWIGANQLAALLTQRLRTAGYGGTADPENERQFLWKYYKEEVAPDLFFRMGVSMQTLPRFDIARLVDRTQLPPFSPADFTGQADGWQLRQFFTGRSVVTPDPNADMVSLIGRGVSEAEWAHIAEMIRTLDRWNTLAAIHAPSLNWRPVRQFGAAMRRYWQTLVRWECVYQPYGAVTLFAQEYWPVEDQIKYQQKFEQFKVLAGMMGRQWTAPLPWAIPQHPTEVDAALALASTMLGTELDYETTWRSMIDVWWGSDAALAEDPAAVAQLATAGGAELLQKSVDTGVGNRYILWLALLAVGLVLIGATK